MEPLLWLLLIGRIIRWVAPLVVGVLGAVLAFLIFGRAIPGGWVALLLFVAVVFWLARAVKDVLSSSRNDRSSHRDNPPRDL